MVTGSLVVESCRGGEYGYHWGLSVVIDQRSFKHVGVVHGGKILKTMKC